MQTLHSRVSRALTAYYYDLAILIGLLHQLLNEYGDVCPDYRNVLTTRIDYYTSHQNTIPRLLDALDRATITVTNP